MKFPSTFQIFKRQFIIVGLAVTITVSSIRGFKLITLSLKNALYALTALIILNLINIHLFKNDNRPNIIKGGLVWKIAQTPTTKFISLLFLWTIQLLMLTYGLSLQDIGDQRIIYLALIIPTFLSAGLLIASEVEIST